LITWPLTVRVSVPLVGTENVKLTLLISPSPVPINGPDVDAPLRVILPVPVKDSVWVPELSATD
jgi:hypothetical protein